MNVLWGEFSLAEMYFFFSYYVSSYNIFLCMIPLEPNQK